MTISNKNILTTEKLEDFFNNWAKIRSNEPSPPVIVDRKNTGFFELDTNVGNLKSFFTEYEDARKSMVEEWKQGIKANVWRAANLGRNEVRNSMVLRWFLDAGESHGQGSEFLKLFLSPLQKPSIQQISDCFYRATEECCPSGSSRNRVDIEIESEEYLLFIEVKIDASEGENQLQRYCDIAKAKAGNNKYWAVIYLTVDGTIPDIYQKNEKILALSWKQIAKAFKGYEQNNYGAWLIRQFAEHIETF